MVNAVRDRSDLFNRWRQDVDEAGPRRTESSRTDHARTDRARTDRARTERTQPTTSTSEARKYRPSLQTRSDARKANNADPRTNQLRNKIERSVPPKTDGFPQNGTVDEAKAYLKANPPPSGGDLASWTPDQRRAFNVLAQDFGTRHAAEHRDWHRRNGPGGTQGSGSGEEFLAFHRGMMNDFRRETGIDPPRDWDPTKPVPPELEDPTGARRNSNANVSLPNFLSPGGNGTEAGNRDFGRSVTIDGKTYEKLEDFEDPDTLGRALGESGYHASAHSRLGGIMAGFDSPRDPSFYLWHGHIDRIIDQWLQTPNGQRWAAANPGHRLLDPNYSAHGGHSH